MPRRLWSTLASVPPSDIGHVYFFATHDKRFVKVGWSSDIHRRWKAIQAANPEPLAFLGAIEASRDVETGWHRHHRDRRVSGEWFTLDKDFAAEIEFCCDGRGDYELTVEDIREGRPPGPIPPERLAEIQRGIARESAPPRNS